MSRSFIPINIWNRVPNGTVHYVMGGFRILVPTMDLYELHNYIILSIVCWTLDLTPLQTVYTSSFRPRSLIHPQLRHRIVGVSVKKSLGRTSGGIETRDRTGKESLGVGTCLLPLVPETEEKHRETFSFM